jgi:hypothetical protein
LINLIIDDIVINNQTLLGYNVDNLTYYNYREFFKGQEPKNGIKPRYKILTPFNNFENITERNVYEELRFFPHTRFNAKHRLDQITNFLNRMPG